MQKIIPHLWFDKDAEEAAAFYISVFSGGKIIATTRYTDAGREVHGMEAGTVLTVRFSIEGFEFVALNGGPAFQKNPSISFTIHCGTKEKANEVFARLADGGKVMMPLDAYPWSERYGWVEDKYGVSWQVIFSKTLPPDQLIVPALMFSAEMTGQAEEAIRFYSSVFKDSAVAGISRYGADQLPDEEGTIAHAEFILAGQRFSAMDSARNQDVRFNEGISLMVKCNDQEEIDHFFDELSAVPEAEQCGWLKDKYGVSWQIVPEGLDRLLSDEDPDRARRVMEAILSMKKIDMEILDGIS